MKKVILILLLLTTIIVMVPAVSFTQEVIDSQRMDLDLEISNSQFFEISITPAVTFDINFNPDIIFETRTVSQDSENFLTILVEPDITYDNTGTFSLNASVTGVYGTQIYFTPDSTFPVGLEIVPDAEVVYSNISGLDLDAGLYLAFLGGRVVNQGLLLDAKILSDALGTAVADDVLRKIAVVIASFYELNGNEPDVQVEQLASDLAVLLGMVGQELRVYNAYQQVLGHRSTRVGRDKDANTGFQFKIGFQTDFSLATTNLRVLTLPELTFAGNFGDTVWFDIHTAIGLPSVNYTFGGSTPDFFSLDQMDGMISADLNWFISPVLSLNFGTDALFIDFISDPADMATPTPETFVTSTLAFEYGVTDSLSLEIEIPVNLVPTVDADLGIYISWDIL
ncbi:MAG: hypothetical protein HQ557_15530 [Bacteroidetes bacterium]|nr:hypothetical protein [Bacteroidota bacterium]